VRVVRLVSVTDDAGQHRCGSADDVDLDAVGVSAAALAGDPLPPLAGGFGLAVAPAVANAIDDAVGVRVQDLPLTRDAVHRGLRATIGAPLPATTA
jgi:hypothetical protein